jgi:hypothetical protein
MAKIPQIPQHDYARALEALRVRAEIGHRDRGDTEDSFIKVSDLVAAGVVRVDALGRLQLPAPVWTPPIFENSWVNVGSGNNPAGYYKDALNRVHLRGYIMSGTVGNAAFTLPAGFRPEAAVISGVLSNGAIGRVDVNASGTVVPASPSNNASVSLENISFVAHQ